MPKSSCSYFKRLCECSIKSEENNSKFAFNDPGTNNRAVVNADGRHCRKIRIDGALHEVQPNKCDWCLWDYNNNVFLFLELKGTDWSHAVVQLDCTVTWFKKHIDPFIIYKETYIVMKNNCSIPSTDTKFQIAQKKFMASHCSLLLRKHSGHHFVFSKK